jgi:dienelactone hydrolase
MHSAPPLQPRQDVSFASAGTTCRGWLTLPATAGGKPVPLVLMAHGFGGTRDMHLEQYAQRFNAAGMATLIFDYRCWGASDGEPRNRLDPDAEIGDWLAALAFVRTLPGVDSARIALWGTSFAGGLVVSVAARDGKVAATVSQCPLLDGLAAAVQVTRYAGPLALLRVSAHGVFDAARALAGATPHYIPIVAKPGETGAMTSADAWEGYVRLCPPGFRNEVTARTALRVPLFRPIRDAARVRCPALLQICETDSVAPVSAVEKAAKKIAKAEVVRYPVGHFDVYFGDAFERSVTDQLNFLKKHLRP